MKLKELLKGIKEVFKPPVKKYYIGKIQFGSPYFYPINFVKYIIYIRILKRRSEEAHNEYILSHPYNRNKFKAAFSNLPMVRRNKEWIFKIFGKDIEGKICYEVLQGLDKRCDFCTNAIIKKQEGEPYYWVYFNPVSNEVYIIADVYSKLKTNNSTIHTRFEIAVPIDNKMKLDLIEAWKKKA
jgi:hypothetical protein